MYGVCNGRMHAELVEIAGGGSAIKGATPSLEFGMLATVCLFLIEDHSPLGLIAYREMRTTNSG